MKLFQIEQLRMVMQLIYFLVPWIKLDFMRWNIVPTLPGNFFNKNIWIDQGPQLDSPEF